MYVPCGDDDYISGPQWMNPKGNAASPATVIQPPPPKITWGQRGGKVWAATITELKHQGRCFRLTWQDIKMASKLASRRVQGDHVTRREKLLLKRVGKDVLLLGPFSVFVVVPFLEFTLPFFLWVFPNMLPSQFRSKSRALRAIKTWNMHRTVFADNLTAVYERIADERNLGDFKEFLARVRLGESGTAQDILTFAPIFENIITLESWPRPQLVACCRVLHLKTYGSDSFLRYQLKHKLRSLKDDDKLLMSEGVDKLNLDELKEANRMRGMSDDRPSTVLQQQLQDWLDLSSKDVPHSLLLSRAFTC